MLQPSIGFHLLVDVFPFIFKADDGFICGLAVQFVAEGFVVAGHRVLRAQLGLALVEVLHGNGADFKGLETAHGFRGVSECVVVLQYYSTQSMHYSQGVGQKKFGATLKLVRTKDV